MPYVIAPMINKALPGLWFEGNPYDYKNIYDINSEDPKAPPVNYNSYTIKPHSVAHIDAPSHVIRGGMNADDYYLQNKLGGFWGRVLVVRLKGNAFKEVPGMKGVSLWEVSLSELKTSIREANNGSETIPDRLILTLDNYPENDLGLHDPNKVLVLDQEAAAYLVSNPKFVMYGTSWKSSDFKPGSRERPIHKTLLAQACVFECLDLKIVPQGEYFLCAFPLPLAGASESPVCPVLFEADELNF